MKLKQKYKVKGFKIHLTLAILLLIGIDYSKNLL